MNCKICPDSSLVIRKYFFPAEPFCDSGTRAKELNLDLGSSGGKAGTALEVNQLNYVLFLRIITCDSGPLPMFSICNGNGTLKGH